MSDVVTRPDHYTEGGIETIDFIESKGMLEDFCTGNAIKYISRAPFKNKLVEDLKKATWYCLYLIMRKNGVPADFAKDRMEEVMNIVEAEYHDANTRFGDE